MEVGGVCQVCAGDDPARQAPEPSGSSIYQRKDARASKRLLERMAKEVDAVIAERRAAVKRDANK